MVNTIVLCGILAASILSIQLVLCTKAKRIITKLIPVYLITATYLLAVVLCVIDVVNGSGGVAIWSIFSFIISIVNTVALVADLLAWIIYKVRLT